MEEALQDAERLLPTGPTLLVAASMGAWIAASLAQAPQVRGLLLLAPSEALKAPHVLPSSYSRSGAYRIHERIKEEQEASIESRMPADKVVRHFGCK